MSEDDEENTFGVTRYACMPSLIALQQMRNRLHLAHLGKKLMKWTALASGRELRRIAIEMNILYEGFNEEMRNAYILLARSRYFSPQLNGIVTENVGKNAGVTVYCTVRNIVAVKVAHYQVYENDCPYAHLGIGAGGQTIAETKEAWLALLKHLVMMLEMRTTFSMVEAANGAATK